MRRMIVILAVLLTLSATARAEPLVYTREAVGWGFVAFGLVAGALSTALLVQNASAADYPYQRAAGWSAVGLSGAMLICGVITLNVPPRRLKRLAVSPAALTLSF